MTPGIRAFGLAVGLIAVVALAQDQKAQEDAARGDIAAGQEIFEILCSDCHNADSNVVKTGPGFKGLKDGKLPSGDDATRENVLAVIEYGSGDAMPPIEERLRDKEKDDLIAYVLSR